MPRPPRDPTLALPPITDSRRGERLQRVMADAGVASRRLAEELILAGRVTVNSQPVDTLPAWVNPQLDRIHVDGVLVPPPERLIYIILNKPAHTLATSADEPGFDRRTVLDLVDHPAAPRLFPVGRMAYETLGLVLLTNDGELANRLTHPRYGVPKTYRAVVRGQLTEQDLEQIQQGIHLAERKATKGQPNHRASRVELAIERAEPERTLLVITLREGRNMQVERMMAAVGHPVRKLERVAMGPLKLKGVARGQWRELSAIEVKLLRRATASAARDVAAGRTPTHADPVPLATPFRVATPADRVKARTTRSRPQPATKPAAKPPAKTFAKPAAKPAPPAPAPKPATKAPPKSPAKASPKAKPARRPTILTPNHPLGARGKGGPRGF